MSKKGISILLDEKDYERLKLIAQKEYRTVKACVEVITLEYIKLKHPEVTNEYI